MPRTNIQNSIYRFPMWHHNATDITSGEMSKEEVKLDDGTSKNGTEAADPAVEKQSLYTQARSVGIDQISFCINDKWVGFLPFHLFFLQIIICTSIPSEKQYV